MSFAVKMDKQCRSVAIVINDPTDGSVLEDFQFRATVLQAMKANQYRFALIRHDMDTDENGELKRPHWHLIAEAPTGQRPRAKTWVLRLSQVLGYPENCISVMQLTTWETDFQYLVHKNNPEKYQYSVSEVLTSDSPDVVQFVMSQTIDVELDIPTLVRIIQEEKGSLIGIGSRIGLSRLQIYIRVIDLLKRELGL